ncbi:MAG: diguanylate cyclase [Sulfurimicrobium sp.]|nr:diguanylate cyclase [Sulfurimicrobium sp.]MDP2198708.1 diguanylate cyclase [Sulfurimicrobium sp.]MDP3689168.1 diguanylate cyclase [Sulfurimicrobium sp.]
MNIVEVKVSLPERLLEQARLLADKLGLPLDRLVAQSLQECIPRQGLSLDENLAQMDANTQAYYASAWWFKEWTENAPVMTWVTDLEGQCIYVNKGWISYTGQDETAAHGLGWMAAIHEEDREQWRESFAKALRTRTSFIVESRLRRVDGACRWIVTTAVPHLDADGTLVGYIGSCLDITPRKMAEDGVIQASQAMEMVGEGIMVTDPALNVVWVNSAFTRVTGYSQADMTGANPSLMRSGKHDDAFYAAMWEHIRLSGRWQGEIWNRRKNGDIYPEWLSIHAMYDEQGRLTHYVGMFSEITDKKRREDELRFRATHDALTGLNNRYSFEEHLEFALCRSRRNGKGLALLFLDLDDFKHINDTHGHLIGDDLLVHVAKRLADVMRDIDTISRLGGDEFTIILEGLENPVSDVRGVAEKILALLNEPFDLVPGHCLHVGASIGIVVAGVENTVRDLLLRSDNAMYAAKNSGKGSYVIFDARKKAVDTAD